ncbi:MAG: caspase family protein, partial [Verrucomicrobiota bacterium]
MPKDVAAKRAALTITRQADRAIDEMKRTGKHSFWKILSLAFLLLPEITVAEGRFALVIGNTAYEHANPLPNATNDSADVARVLEKAEWQVTRADDLGIRNMLRTLRLFASEAAGAEAALIYYAGHG